MFRFAEEIVVEKNGKRMGVGSWFSLILLVMTGIQIERRGEMLVFDEAQASTAATSAVSGSCNDPVVAAFAPTFGYAIAWSNPAAGTQPTCTATLTLTNPINADTAPSITCALQTSGEVFLYSQTPKIKFGGLQCQTQDRVILEMHGDGTDNTSFDVGYQPTGTTSYISSKKVDAATSGSKKMVFGTSGTVGSAALIDGNDNDGLINGEIAFGGSSETTGGSVKMIKVDVTNIDVNVTDSTETVTYTLTPQ